MSHHSVFASVLSVKGHGLVTTSKHDFGVTKWLVNSIEELIKLASRRGINLTYTTF